MKTPRTVLPALSAISQSKIEKVCQIFTGKYYHRISQDTYNLFHPSRYHIDRSCSWILIIIYNRLNIRGA